MKVTIEYDHRKYSIEYTDVPFEGIIHRDVQALMEFVLPYPQETTDKV